MKFGNFGNLDFLKKKYKLVFAVSAHSHDQVLIFIYICCSNNEYCLDNISRIWVQRVWEKLINYIHFSTKIFPVDQIINLGNYIWRTWFIHKNT